MTGLIAHGWFRCIALLVGALATTGSVADPDEAWLRRAALPDGALPLLALVIDTSAATAQPIRLNEPYDALRDYGAALPAPMRCDAASVYWRRGAGPAPDCVLQAGLALAPANASEGLQCEAARTPLARHGFFIASRAAQWRAEGQHWTSLSARSTAVVECRADRGRHGAMSGAYYAGDGAAGPWRNDPAGENAWDRSPHADPYIFYTGNFLNYLRSAPVPTDRPIGDVALRSLAAALSATAELEVALIRVDPDGPAGGYVSRAPVDSALAAGDLEAMAGESPSGSAPLGETLAETIAWLSGGPIRFGTDARADAAAFDPSTGSYRSPFDYACRPVSLAVLTAGVYSDGCEAECLAERVQQLASADLRDDLAGVQRAPAAWLTAAADATPDPFELLSDPLAYVNLVARSFQHDATVPGAPQLSAAGITPFAGDATRPGVIFGLTAPVARQRWPGNLLRYALRAPASPLAAPTLVDRDGEPAIDPASGLPWPGSRSLWSDAPDANLLAGGAAGRLPAPDSRQIQTDVAGGRILEPANRLEPGNPLLNRGVVGLAATDPEPLEEVLAWPAGLRTLGDPGLHAPIIVDYSDAGRQIVFAATHDGVLQAFDAESGVELWAWMPQELLPRLPQLLRDEVTAVRRHGIDGPLVLHRHDPDGDGRIDLAAGEHLWLLFGLGRGGNRYHAIDISSADDPRLLWSIDLPGEDVQARAEPVVTRLAIDGSAQSAGDWVVLLAGGYDHRFDSPQATGSGLGNSLHVFDALTGRRLWSGGDGDGHELRIPGLASLPSAPRALDLDGDGYLDRAYFVDVTGGVWRMGFRSGRAPNELADARRIAELGSGQHRFYATPDVSVARIGDESRIAIAMGSGWLTRPEDTSVVDRAYVLFDRDAAADTNVLTEADLHDATAAAAAMPATAAGWFVRLERHGQGEKVVGGAVTFDHALRFQTYEPLPIEDSAPCGPPRAMVRLYSLDVRSGLSYATAIETEEDEPEEIVASGLPVDLRFGLPDRWEEPCPGCRPRPFGMAGAETFDTGYAGDPVKTSWRKLAPPPASP